VTSGLVAIAVALLSWAFVEGLGHLYPSRATWRKLRRVRGRAHVRRMRERFQEAGDRRSGRKLALALVLLVVIWVGVSGWLDKKWYEVVADAAPSSIVLLSLLRLPASLRAIAERIKEYEREAGEDPDEPIGEDGGGPEVLAL
jgi:hypothetical protein